MAITAADIKTLRENTGAGMLECKKALAEANGDLAEAEKILKEKGLAAMEKRSDRATGEGRIVIKQDGNKLAIVEVTCETDFVANNEDFVAIADKAAEITLKNGKSEVTDEHKALINEIAIKFRENMSVRRADFVELGANAVAGTYVHTDNKTGAIVVVEGAESEDVKSFAKDCCLHLAAFTPAYIKKEDVPESYVNEQKEIFQAQMAQDEKMASKPENVKAGILQGKINKHLAEICFVDQAFVKDDKVTVAKKLEEVSKAAGAKLSFGKIVLYVLGK
ncbi:translation elongation factor Ts [uncultured Treponema sp.]|uniref:translation elongation factor Ts n=1 Tax=uncultured Treponema sp. TaxID=162155 RepID=UPI0025FB3097|nr:translation elongation factor Ts [uncultured Treponema sp.]